MKTRLLRWLLTAVCCSFGLAQAQTIGKIEYFFDTDPGIGNGTAVAFSPVSNLDSTFSFEVSVLSNGLHVVYVRSMDAGNKWSLTYSSSFIKTAGSDIPLGIVKLEYFVDTDPGYGLATDIPLTTGNVIDSSFDLVVPDNGADLRFLAIRALDSRGQWSLLYTDTISMCNLYKAKPGFSWIRYADLFSFIDSSKNNPSHHLVWKFGNLGTSTVSNPQFTFPQGNYLTTLVAGDGCRKDSVTLPLFVGLEKYTPEIAYNGADIVMNFYGGGLDTNLVVTLTNNAGANITSYFKGAFDLQRYTGMFDLHTAPAGVYDVHLHFSGGYDTTITDGLLVLPIPSPDYQPEISISMSGPTRARYGTTIYPNLVITNNSPSVVAKFVPVFITADYSVNWSPLKPLNIISPPQVTPYLDSIPSTLGIDSFIVDGSYYSAQVHNYIIPYIGPGESVVIPLSITGPLQEGYTIIYYWTNKTMFGSPFRVYWGDCFDAIIDFALTTAGVLVPPIALANCISSLFVNFSYDAMQLAMDAADGKANYANFVQLVAGSLIGCIPGAQVAKLVKAAGIAVKMIQAIWDQSNNLSSFANGQSGLFYNCYSVAENPFGPRFKGKYEVAWDPNDISGPTGYDVNRYVSNKDRLNYEVYFENLPSATAPAQRIYVRDTLDKTTMDLSTFAFTGFSLADSFKTIPPRRNEYTTTLDLRPGKDILLRINAKMDTASGILSYDFLSLDPVTKDTLPLSDVRGFLPPDLDGISGRGGISYVVSMKKNLPHGTIIDNRASIVFDNHAPILTSTWTNTLDTIAPVGIVASGVLINDTTVRITMSGTDVGAGIQKYRLFVAEGNKPYELRNQIWGDTTRFTGKLDSTYRFYVVPYDSVGNYASKTAVAEYTITFSHALPVTIISFDAQKQQKDVVCKWQTTDEMNLSHYIVERSADGIRYETAGTVTAQNSPGIKNYQFKDLNALTIYSQSKKLYYRLKMVDLDRTSKYSRVARIDLDKKYTVTVYPNPAGKELFIQGLQYYKQLQVIDIHGRIVMSEIVKPGMQSINIERLTAGSYILKLSADDDVQSLKVIKN